MIMRVVLVVGVVGGEDEVYGEVGKLIEVDGVVVDDVFEFVGLIGKLNEGDMIGGVVKLVEGGMFVDEFVGFVEFDDGEVVVGVVGNYYWLWFCFSKLLKIISVERVMMFLEIEMIKFFVIVLLRLSILELVEIVGLMKYVRCRFLLIKFLFLE